MNIQNNIFNILPISDKRYYEKNKASIKKDKENSISFADILKKEMDKTTPIK